MPRRAATWQVRSAVHTPPPQNLRKETGNYVKAPKSRFLSRAILSLSLCLSLSPSLSPRGIRIILRHLSLRHAVWISPIQSRQASVPTAAEDSKSAIAMATAIGAQGGQLVGYFEDLSVQDLVCFSSSFLFKQSVICRCLAADLVDPIGLIYRLLPLNGVDE
ncbi:hypothetical protein CRG98_021829 [Punica granatum]|uniref:Uncharacterized protein n=1 Tax=Punica granatum TaxID=22663 RepID=A0A2I0JNA7_PUNGR|nr:hypothetical protein CRG98_021829 [Punica granatum]